MSPRRRIRLIHWKEDEVPERAARLEALGYEVDGAVPGTSIGIKALRNDPPDAFVVDLGRLPARGREVGYELRQAKGLRRLPIVFVDGAAEKVARVRELLPDAAYASWDGVGEALTAAIAAPPSVPVVPRSGSGPASGRPLAAKLGIKAGMRLVLLDAPDGIEEALAPLPEGVVSHRGNRGCREMTLWFTTSRRQFAKRFGAVARAVGEGVLWIAWPKGSSGVETDLNEGAVRDVALPAGMVDTKVCAIDATWSGLRLTLRRS